MTDFDGKTYVPERDRMRLRAQLEDVFALMKDGAWRTLGQIETQTGHPQASISARLRDFRKAKFGGHKVERQYLGDGLFHYRLTISTPCPTSSS